MTTATARQTEYLGFIRRFWATRHRPPTVREIGAALGVSSPNGVAAQLKALARKGLIEWDRGHTARGIFLPGLRAYIAACPLLTEGAADAV